MKEFFICPNCGNNKDFKIFMSDFQFVRQSPEQGVRTAESDLLPSLRQKDNYIECQSCFKRLEYDTAAAIGKKYIQTTLRLLKSNKLNTTTHSAN